MWRYVPNIHQTSQKSSLSMNVSHISCKVDIWNFLPSFFPKVWPKQSPLSSSFLLSSSAPGSIFFKFWYDSYTIKFILKGIIQWVLAYSQGCVTITANSRTLSSTHKGPGSHWQSLPFTPSAALWQPLVYCLSPRICLFWSFYTNRIIGYVASFT